MLWAYGLTRSTRDAGNAGANQSIVKAITATAHKLVRLIYTMLTKGTEYVDRGQDYYEERYRERVIHHLNRRASAVGFDVTPIQPVAA